MVSKRHIVDNTLMRLLIGIKYDTFWKMVSSRTSEIPSVGDEGATGKLDNKGAIFLPYMVSWDSGGREINLIGWDTLSENEFCYKVTKSLERDGATMLSPKGIAPNYELGTESIVNMARHILKNNRAEHKKNNRVIKIRNPVITLDDIVKTCTPNYVNKQNQIKNHELNGGLPNGRTNVSSGLAVLRCYPASYLVELEDKHPKYHSNLTELDFSPIKSNKGRILARPYIIVCHTTRFRKSATNYGSIIRVLGYSSMSFLTFSLESTATSLSAELTRKRKGFRKDDFFGGYRNLQGKEIYAVGVLRFYESNKWGNFPKIVRTMLVSPTKDLNLNLIKITKEACERYDVDKKRILYPSL
ncbi:hypothetical protein GF323_06335 [Candidatus Woesearchaeota archaeon]|nr:hypothetical protein [Candidatus Woesearchaeota archaeon]